MSHKEAPSTASSQGLILNLPSTLPGCINHVFQDGLKAPERGSVFKSPARMVGLTEVCRSSMPFPTSFGYKRKPVRLEAAEPLQLQSSTQLFPLAGVLALREVLFILPDRLLPPILCIGNHSPPVLIGASYRRASTGAFTYSCSPWPCIGTACRCLW